MYVTALVKKRALPTLDQFLESAEVEAYWAKPAIVKSDVKRTQLHELSEKGLIDAALEEQVITSY